MSFTKCLVVSLDIHSASICYIDIIVLNLSWVRLNKPSWSVKVEQLVFNRDSSNFNIALASYNLSIILQAFLMTELNCWRLFVNSLCLRFQVKSRLQLQTMVELHQNVWNVFDLCVFIRLVIILNYCSRLLTLQSLITKH